MAKPNPLLRSKLAPVGEEGTQVDIAARLFNPLKALSQNFARSNFVQKLKVKGSRSAAKVSLALTPDDRLADDYVEGKESYENLIYSVFKQDPKLISTLVENIQSGAFDHILNNRLVAPPVRTEYQPISQLDQELMVYSKLYHWSNRLQKLFVMAQGFLAGFAMLYLYLLFFSTTKSTFVTVYSEIARVVSTLLQSLVMIAMLGSLHTLLAEYRHYRHVAATELDFDTEKHRAPYYVAWFCSICYGVCYLISLESSYFVNEIFYDNQRDSSWAASGNYSSGFENRMSIWSYLGAIESILAIIVWIVICSQSYWNTGSLYAMKLAEPDDDATVAEEDSQTEVYQHLFYGNPYLPTGVFELAV